MNVHPKDFEMAAHIFWMEYALNRTMVLDFLSDRAKRSIAAHLAEAVNEFFDYHFRWEIGDKTMADSFKYDRFQYFEKAMLEHPLGELFGEKFAKVIDKSCQHVYSLLQQGKDPALEDRRI